MSEPQHPAPFGGHTGNQPGGQPDGQAMSGGAASSGVQAGSLESIAAVGARLMQLREAKGWSIDDVSARLKVSPQKLRLLEAGDLSHLPDRTFAAGIVRSYAKMLGADPAPFTAALRRARRTGRTESHVAGVVRERIAARTRVGAARRFGAPPLVAVGRRGGHRGRDRARDVAYGRRFRRVARAPEGERQWHGGVERGRHERGVVGRDTRRGGCSEHRRGVVAGRDRDCGGRRGRPADAASARHQRAARVVVGDCCRSGRERRRAGGLGTRGGGCGPDAGPGPRIGAGVSRARAETRSK